MAARNNNAYQYFKPDWNKIRKALKNGDEAAVSREYRRLKRQFANVRTIYDKMVKRDKLERAKGLKRKDMAIERDQELAPEDV